MRYGSYIGGRWWKDGRTDCECGEVMACGDVGGVGGVTWEVRGDEFGTRTLFSLSSCITSLTISPRLDWTENCATENYFLSHSSIFSICSLYNAGFQLKYVSSLPKPCKNPHQLIMDARLCNTSHGALHF